MAGNVLAHIGIHATELDDPCGPGLHLHLTPAVMDDDGHVDFGVLGVFLDMASSQAGVHRGFVHADISVHRVGKPRGEKLFVDARMARAGKRSAVLHIDVHDDLGTRIAYSVQQIRFAGEAPAEVDAERMAAFRKVFYEQFDGHCTLPGPLHELLDLRSDGGVWRMPLSAASRNGFGALHGGVAFALVGDAAAGAAGPGAKATSALIRYLDKGAVGPFRAEPTVMPQADGGAFVRVEVFDEGADDLLIILAEAHVVDGARS
jgi:acyl-coenzyme A thioesterase PaaI-like protein